MATHLIIPDTQVRAGVPTEHLTWIGKYAVARKPDTIIHLGDHWDMPSLSRWNSKMDMEGLRYEDDIKAGNDGLELITKPIRRSKGYEPRLVLLRGNHEERILRAIGEDPRLAGVIGYHDLESPDWETHGFLEPVFIDGIGYSHYWANPMTGRPYGGMMETRLKTLGHSFTQGHVQTLQTGIRFIHGPNGPQQQRGLVAGACYLHDEDYKGPQGNAHWRGVIVKHQVRDGAYDLMEVSLDYLCRKYEGVSLTEFMKGRK